MDRVVCQRLHRVCCHGSGDVLYHIEEETGAFSSHWKISVHKICDFFCVLAKYFDRMFVSFWCHRNRRWIYRYTHTPYNTPSYTLSPNPSLFPSRNPPSSWSAGHVDLRRDAAGVRGAPVDLLLPALHRGRPARQPTAGGRGAGHGGKGGGGGGSVGRRKRSRRKGQGEAVEDTSHIHLPNPTIRHDTENTPYSRYPIISYGTI